MATKRVNAADVRMSYDRTAANEPWCMIRVVRPLSFVLTPPFHNTGWSANAVTWLRLVFSVIGLILLATPDYTWRCAGVGAFYFGYLLDGIDGNLARMSDSASYLGKYLDGLADDLSILWSPLAVGIGWWLETADAKPLAAGCVLTALALFTHSSRNRLSFFRVWMIEETGPLTDQQAALRERLGATERRLVNVLVNFQFFAPILIVLPSGPEIFVAVTLVVQGPVHLVWVGTVIRQAHGLLRRGRRSGKAGGA